MPDSELAMVDLFCGAGGLSLGLEAAGFQPWLAVDASDMAGETYFRNFVSPSEAEWTRHRSSPVQDQIARGVAIAPTELVIDKLDEVRRRLNGREVALVAGGPPCQGFSLAGLRNPLDQRNRLPFEFLRFVRELRPQTVLIENVTGIGARFTSSEPSALEELAAALAVTGSDGYLTQIVELDASQYGVAQRRQRIMIVGLRGDIAARFSVQPTDDIAALLSSPRWSSTRVGDAPPLLAPPVDSGPPRTVGEALGDIGDTGYLYGDISDYPATLRYAGELRIGAHFRPRPLEQRPSGGPANHNLRRHGPTVEARFRLYLALAPFSIRENVFGLAIKHQGDARDALRAIKSVLELHRVPEPLKMPDGTPVTDDNGRDVGVNHASLAYAVAMLSTGKHSQRALLEQFPSPTVMSLPDDFVHPRRPRTLTVREMARLQSFPDAFTFHGKETTGALRRRIEVPQYTQVGNAVPPLLAKAVGAHIAGLLKRSRSVVRVSGDQTTNLRHT